MTMEQDEKTEEGSGLSKFDKAWCYWVVILGVTQGGALGGAITAVAGVMNQKILSEGRRAPLRYIATLLISLLSIGVYFAVLVGLMVAGIIDTPPE